MLRLCVLLLLSTSIHAADWWGHTVLPAGYSQGCFETTECPCRDASNETCLTPCNVKECNYCGGGLTCPKLDKDSLPSNVEDTGCENKTSKINPDATACTFTCKDKPNNESDTYAPYVNGKGDDKLVCNALGNATTFGLYNCAKGCAMADVPTLDNTDEYNVTEPTCTTGHDKFSDPFANCTWKCSPSNASAGIPDGAFIQNPVGISCNNWPTLLDGNWSSAPQTACIGPCEGFPQTVTIQGPNGTQEVVLEASDVDCTHGSAHADYPGVGTYCSLKNAKPFNISGDAASLTKMNFTCLYSPQHNGTNGVWVITGDASADKCVDEPANGVHNTWEADGENGDGRQKFKIKCDKDYSPPPTASCNEVVCDEPKNRTSVDGITFTFYGVADPSPTPTCYSNCEIEKLQNDWMKALGNFSTCTNNVTAADKYVAHEQQCTVECMDGSHPGGNGPMCFDGTWTMLDKLGNIMTITQCAGTPSPLPPTDTPVSPPASPPQAPLCDVCKVSDLVTARYVIDPKDVPTWVATDGIPLGDGANPPNVVGKLKVVACVLDEDLKNSTYGENVINVECIPPYKLAPAPAAAALTCCPKEGTMPVVSNWGVPLCVAPPPPQECNLTADGPSFDPTSCPDSSYNATCKQIKCKDPNEAPKFAVDANNMMLPPTCTNGKWENLPTCAVLCDCSPEELCNEFCVIPNAGNRTSGKSCGECSHFSNTNCKKTSITNVKIVPTNLNIEFDVEGGVSSGVWVGLYKIGATDVHDWTYGAYIDANTMLASVGAGSKAQIPINLGDTDPLGDFEAKVFTDLKTEGVQPADSPTMCAEIVPTPAPGTPVSPSSPSSPANPSSPAAKEDEDCGDKVAAFWRVLAIVFIILAAVAGIIVCVLVRKVTSARSDFKELK